jgi:linoleoyl-CoA desaturase
MLFLKEKYHINSNFSKTLRSRVNTYFKTHNKSRNANATMVVKTVIMSALFFLPLIILGSGLITSVWILFSLYILSGLGMAGIGMGVMHDAIHGSYSKNKKINTLLGYSFNLIGANSAVWRIQHNILHHTYTNIENADDDLNAPFFPEIFSSCQTLLDSSVSAHLYLVFLCHINDILDYHKGFCAIKAL